MESIYLHLRSNKATIPSEIIIHVWLITALILQVFEARNCFLFSFSSTKQGIKDKLSKSNNCEPSSLIGISSNFMEISKIFILIQISWKKSRISLLLKQRNKADTNQKYSKNWSDYSSTQSDKFSHPSHLISLIVFLVAVMINYLFPYCCWVFLDYLFKLICFLLLSLAISRFLLASMIYLNRTSPLCEFYVNHSFFSQFHPNYRKLSFILILCVITLNPSPTFMSDIPPPRAMPLFSSPLALMIPFPLTFISP